MLATPPDVTESVNECLAGLPKNVEGLLGVEKAFVWSHTGSKIMANVSVRAHDSANGQIVTDNVSLFALLITVAGWRFSLLALFAGGALAA